MAEDMDLVKAIRRERGIPHEFLCSACAHRAHDECEVTCSYCTVDCGCVCRRWTIGVHHA